MILRFALVVTIIGFIDSILGVSAFVYLNVQEYRHKQFGSALEVKWSYITGSFGFVKGLALCIPAAQVMVTRKKALIGRWASVLWFVLTLVQIALIGELVYFYFYPSKDFIVSDLFLTILRVVHMVTLLISIIFVFLFWNELSQLLPPKPPKVPKPKKEKKLKIPRKGKNNPGARHEAAQPQNGATGDDPEANESD